MRTGQCTKDLQLHGLGPHGRKLEQKKLQKNLEKCRKGEENMIISSTLVLKSSNSSSFLLNTKYNDILQPTPAFSLTGTAVWLLFYGDLLFFPAAKF